MSEFEPYQDYHLGEPSDGELLALAIDEIERLRAALSIVREYPGFDGGGPLPEMMDQVLRGEAVPILDALQPWIQAHSEDNGITGAKS